MILPFRSLTFGGLGGSNLRSPWLLSLGVKSLPYELGQGYLGPSILSDTMLKEHFLLMSGGWMENGSPHQPATFLGQVTQGQMRNVDVLPVGLHHTGLQGLYLPSFKTKEPRVSDRGINGLTDAGVYTSEARSCSDAQLCVVDSRQDMEAVLAPRGKWRLPVIGGINIRLAHQLPGKLAEGHAPQSPLIRTVTSWGRGKYVGSVMGIRCR